MPFFDSKKLIARKLRDAISIDGLLQASGLMPWLQNKRAVNRQESEDFFAPKSGIFVSQKTKKEMEYESSLEKTVLEALDGISEVKWFDTQCLSFVYSGKDDEYDYFADIVCRTIDQQVVVIEVKPAKTACNWLNYRKYMAGKHLCAKNDWHYLVVSPKEGSLEDMATYHVAKLVENDFVKRFQDRPPGKYNGVRLSEIIDFKQKYDINDRALTAIALKNDLAFHDKPASCAKLETEYSWKKILRSRL